MEWMTLPLKKYAQFGGRSRRKEYWMFVLFSMIVSILAMIVDGILGMNQMIGGVYGPLYTIVALGLLIPTIAVGVRRMHDTNHSGWFLLIPIVNLVFACTEGTRGTNQYGPDPKSPGADVFA